MTDLLEALAEERPSKYQEVFASLSKKNITSEPQSSPPKPQLVKQIRHETNSFIHEKTGLEFVRIPAGEFLFGEKSFRTYLPEYWISKTPVTQAHYQRFILANPSYPVPYINDDKGKPYNWDQQGRTFPHDKANHPVVLVSWYDAIAYSEWAGVRLPTEEEWEKAARGKDGFVYPWGNNWRANCCNSRETSIKGTNRVGQFSPQGDSPYRCVDMSGNVWEWVDSWYDGKNDHRVMRGGSWFNDLGDARTIIRPLESLNYRGGDAGWRVVVHRSPFH
jgi:formylglycine-generating enzyme required for sulfatase activity